MTYRGVYRDGIVILEGEVELRNGAHVKVSPAQDKAGKGLARRNKPRRLTKSATRSKPSAKLPGFGMWKDRWPKSMSSADISRELRQRVSRREP